MNTFNLVQIKNESGDIQAAIVNGHELHLLDVPVFELAMEAADKETTIATLLDSHRTGEVADYDEAIAAGKIQPPICHPDSHREILSGTGLTHLGSAAPRNEMHSTEQKSTQAQTQKTDTQKMFDLGVEGGKGTLEKPGVAPEWFYKGTGYSVNAPYSSLEMPDFSLDAGEEAELAGIYVVSKAGKVFRVGYTLANEFSDHITERKNYLYLAHSKLRNCSFGPELLVGELPEEVTGKVTLSRNSDCLWEREFFSGEKHMCHSIANLEYHHFKYDQFRQPGQLHVHFFGAAVLSCSDGVEMQEGDEISIQCDFMSRPLKNWIKIVSSIPLNINSL